MSVACSASLDTRSTDRLLLRASEEAVERLRQVPGVTRSVRDQGYKAPLSWATYQALSNVFGDDLVIEDSFRWWIETQQVERVGPSMALREEVHLDGSPQLYPFQRAGVAFLSTAERAVLADDLGTGKTRQALLTLRQLNNKGLEPFPALVVCPNATKIPWRREAEKVWPELKVTVIDGSREQRLEQLATPSHVYVINWEAIRFHSSLSSFKNAKSKRCVACGGLDLRVKPSECQTHQRELNGVEWRTVIADEVHRAKDPRAAQTRALWSLTGGARFRYGLSGTPVANNPSDLWSIMHWVSPEDWPDYDDFVDRFCSVQETTFGTKITGIKDDRKDEFFASLDPRMRRMPKQLVLRYLPPVVNVRRDVTLSPQERNAYDSMKNDFLARLEDSEYDLSTTNPMARVTRLLQLSSSYARVSQVRDPDSDHVENRVRLVDPSSKLTMFMRDLQDFSPSESVVVFCVSRQLVDMLSARMKNHEIPHVLLTGAQNTGERQAAIDAFQAREVRFILCTIAAGGTGITLTSGNVAVFLQRSWSMIDNEQAEGRVHRIGSEQHESITVIDYVSSNTLEEFVIQTNARKQDQLEQVLRDKQLLAKLIRENTIDELEHAARD